MHLADIHAFENLSLGMSQAPHAPPKPQRNQNLFLPLMFPIRLRGGDFRIVSIKAHVVCVRKQKKLKDRLKPQSMMPRRKATYALALARAMAQHRQNSRSPHATYHSLCTFAPLKVHKLMHEFKTKAMKAMVQLVTLIIAALMRLILSLSL
ncbi:hypothetical protein PENANT_c024G11421 [Penicillium antarcticum]|uniref:Uncharacterized protein n=1 Tax=Penicillium antarcticum TaxID=416450 RepID=A0A1V6PYD6_9EURO|nr:hypothetical protein PENANT_c024G11421 [Penicillium antarcticum]